MKLNEQIKETRIQECLTQKELAKKVGVDPHTIYRFENGKNGVSFYVLEKIVDVLGLELCKID